MTDFYPQLLGAIRVFDVATLIVYLLATVGIGVYFAKKNKTTSDYFFAGNSMPGWAVGLSMFATSISTVTFVGFPAASFVEDWRMILVNLGFIPGSLLAIYLLIPFFKTAAASSTLEYIGNRFGAVARVYCAITMITIQLVRLGTVLFLMAIPISFITGMPIVWIMAIIGVLTMIYTVSGGLEAVIWTDVIQTFVLVGGSITICILAVSGMPEGKGLGYIINEGIAQGKIAFGDMSFDLSKATFYTMLILGITNFIAIVTDPTVVQRWISTKSLYEARRATWVSLILCICIWTFFYFIGTCLFMYYQFNPDSFVSDLVANNQADSLVPYFIVKHAPVGIAGIITAGVAAAAMSSLSSSINICGTLFVGDIFSRHIVKNRDEKYYFRASLITTFVVSMIMMVGAFAFYLAPKRFMVELSMVVTMIFSGCLGGLFLVALFTKAIDIVAAVASLIFGTIVNGYFAIALTGALPERYMFGFHRYLIGFVVTVCFVLFAFQVVFFRSNVKKAILVLLLLNAYAIITYMGLIPQEWLLFAPSAALIVAVNLIFGVMSFAVAKLFNADNHAVDLRGLTVWTTRIKT